MYSNTLLCNEILCKKVDLKGRDNLIIIIKVAYTVSTVGQRRQQNVTAINTKEQQQPEKEEEGPAVHPPDQSSPLTMMMLLMEKYSNIH